MNTYIRLAVFAVHILLSACLNAAENDFELEQTVIFTVDDEGNGRYELESETIVQQKFISNRSTSFRTIPVYEGFYAEVDAFNVRLNGDRLFDAVKTELQESEDIFIADHKVHRITFPATLKAGDVVNYSYVTSYTDIAYLPILNIPSSSYVKQYKVVIEHPEDVTVDFQFFFPRDSVTYTITHPVKDQTILLFTNLGELESIPYFPFNGIRTSVRLTMQKNGKSILPSSLKDFSQWYTGLFNQSPGFDSIHSELLKDELKTVSSTREKVQVIHDYVRKNIRYIADESSINAIVPRMPSLVLNRGYGDCKDRAFLVSTLARENGINVYMVLLSTSPRPIFSSSTYVNQYNHVICAYIDGKDTLFFDPTHKYCEFGNLPNSDVEAVALIIKPDAPAMVSIPKPNANPSVEIRVTSSLENLKTGKAEIVLHNDYFATAARAQENLTGIELENFLSGLLNKGLYKISLEAFRLDTTLENSIRYHASADLSDFLISSTSKTYIPQMPFRVIDADILDRKKDNDLIYLEYPHNMLLSIDFPKAGLKINEESSAIGEDGFVQYSSTASAIESGGASIQYHFQQNIKKIDQKQREKYLEFCEKYLKAKKKMFTLN